MTNDFALRQTFDNPQVVKFSVDDKGYGYPFAAARPVRPMRCT